jgi:hypothetical protein
MDQVIERGGGGCDCSHDPGAETAWETASVGSKDEVGKYLYDVS